MSIVSYAAAIVALRPNESFTINGDDYSTLVWQEETQPPTLSEVVSKYNELKTEYDSKEYARNRAKAYPTIQEQLDMQYWDSVNGTTTWQDAIEAVKTQYPKP